MQRYLLFAIRVQVWLLVLCLSAGRIVDREVAGVRLALGGSAYKLVPLLALCWAVWRWRERRRPWRGLHLLPPWLLLVAAAGLSAVTALDPKSAVQETLNLGLCVLLLLVVIDLPWSWRALGSVLVAFLVGNVWNLVLILEQFRSGEARVEGSFAHPNILGSFCLLSLGLLAFALFSERRLLVRCGIGVILLGTIVAIYWTGSRATYLGLLAFMGTILLVGSRRELVVTSVLLGALLLFAAGSERVQERYEYTLDQLRVGAGMDRMTVWGLSLALLREQPRPLGLGLGESFNLAVQADPAVSSDPELRKLSHAHNLYLHLLLATGPLGLFAFCWGMAAMYAHVLRPIMREYGGTYTSSPFLLAGIAGLLAQQLFDASLLLQNVLPTLMIYLAMATVLLEVRRAPSTATAAAQGALRSSAATAAGNALVPA